MGIDWSEVWHLLAYVAGAYALALPIAWERERSTRLMGLRTFPLVAVASFAYITVGLEVIGEGHPDAQARLIQGLMTGIGFIGGGAILKSGEQVKGTATATSVWTTGALGAAAGYGRWDVAIVISVVTFLTLFALTPLEEKLMEESGYPPNRDTS